MGAYVKSWPTPRDSSEEPLARLHGRPFERAALAVLLGPSNRVGARYFELCLQLPTGKPALSSLLLGLHHQGSAPSTNWIEVIESCWHVALEGVEHQVEPLVVFGLLRDVIPPGGHIMVEYESPEWEETRLTLARGVPPLLTPLGFSLYQAGFRGGFKDWAIAEGGSEGPRKLQASRQLSSTHEREKAHQLVSELEDFLSGAKVDIRGVGRMDVRLKLAEALQDWAINDAVLLERLRSFLNRSKRWLP